MRIIAIVIIFLIVIAAFLIFILTINYSKRSNIQCKNQLRDFFPLIVNYCIENKKTPICFNDILNPWGNNQKEIALTFGCPQYVKSHSSDNSSGYIFVPWKVKDYEEIPNNAPLIYDKSFSTHKDGVYVLTAKHGAVIFITDKNYFLKFKKINDNIIIPED